MLVWFLFALIIILVIVNLIVSLVAMTGIIYIAGLLYQIGQGDDEDEDEAWGK